MKTCIGAIVLPLLLSAAGNVGDAGADIGDQLALYSHATASSGSIEAVPDGSGATLAERGLTITVTVLDPLLRPVAGHPWQDIWAHNIAAGGDLATCQAGIYASAVTDANGVTTIEGPLFAGGSTETLYVYINGVPVYGDGPLAISVRSADFDADLDVDVADLVLVPGGFANLFLNGVYDWRADLNGDDVENILDVALFAQRFLAVATCPD